MKNIAVNFIENFKYLIPKKIRGQRFVSLLSMLLTPIQSLNVAVRSWVMNTRYTLSFTGQIMYLEHILNDLFDPNLRLIYIDEPAVIQNDEAVTFYEIEQQPQDNYIYYVSENEPETYVYYVSEYQNVPHFIVKVPSVIHSLAIENAIKAIVNYYKIAGKRYIIETY